MTNKEKVIKRLNEGFGLSLPMDSVLLTHLRNGCGHGSSWMLHRFSCDSPMSEALKWDRWVIGDGEIYEYVPSCHDDYLGREWKIEKSNRPYRTECLRENFDASAVYKIPTEVHFIGGATNVTIYRPLPLKVGDRIHYQRIDKVGGYSDYGTITVPHYTKTEPTHIHNKKHYVCDGFKAVLDSGMEVVVYFDETQIEENLITVDYGTLKIIVEILNIE